MATLYDPILKCECYDVLDALPRHLLDIPVLNHGFVRVLDVMPRLVPVGDTCDVAVTHMARQSYQKGTKSLSDDAGLIDHLVRNEHTSPIEGGELKFHLRMPIFVARQHIRHRTASVNEESARYSVLEDDFYVPDPGTWATNTSRNKQATEQVDLSQDVVSKLHSYITKHSEESYNLYKRLLSGDEESDPKIPGVAREQARMVLGTNIFTKMVWKIDLKNLLHYLRLRCASDAQYEIRVYADAMAGVVSRLFPMTYASFVDNMVDGVRFSGFELRLLSTIIKSDAADAISLMDEKGWSQRRRAEFIAKLANSDLYEL